VSSPRAPKPTDSHSAGAPSADPRSDVGFSASGTAPSEATQPVLDLGSVEGAGGEPQARGPSPLRRGPGTESPGLEARTESLGQRGPGASNTRGQTPAGQGRALQHGVDSLVLAAKGEVPDFVLARLARALNGTSAVGVAQIDGHRFEVSRVGKSFKCANADCALILGRDQSGFDFVFEARALYLRTHRLAEVLATARRLASKVLARAPRFVRVRRLDLFVDVAGVTFGPGDAEAFVSRAKKGTEFHVPERSYTRKAAGEVQTTGFMFAPGNPVLVRLYDKREELIHVHGAGSEKTKTELAAYHAAGWLEGEPVWRLEAQLRTKGLQELGVTDVSVLERSIPALWDHMFSGATPWLRLVVLATATRRERMAIDPRWEAFRQQHFLASDTPAPLGDGLRGGISPEQALGSLFSLLGGHGALEALSAEQSVAEMLASDMDAAVRLLKSHLPYSGADYLRLRESARARRSHLEERDEVAS